MLSSLLSLTLFEYVFSISFSFSSLRFWSGRLIVRFLNSPVFFDCSLRAFYAFVLPIVLKGRSPSCARTVLG